MKIDIYLRIIIVNPFPGVKYALQVGKGPGFKTQSHHRSEKELLVFDLTCTCIVKDDSTIDFSGPSIQGPKSGRFIYIGVGTYAGDFTSMWSRRIKVSLHEILPLQIEEINKGNLSGLTCSINGIGKDGTPACASIKTIDGWNLY